MQNIKNFINESKTRIITAFVLSAFILFVVWLDSFFLTWLVLGVVYILGFYEACKLFNISEFKLYAIAAIVWIVAGFSLSPWLILSTCVIIMLSAMLQKQNMQLKYLLPFAYPSIPMMAFLTLYSYYGMFYILWLIIIVSLTDIAAYVVGKLIGKTQFCVISPKKTLEGVIGGVVIGTIAGIFVGLNEFNFLSSLLISVFVSLFSVWGDLFESYLKRIANLKDSGSLFPGHGGVLDRVDGYMFGVIVMLVLLEGAI